MISGESAILTEAITELRAQVRGAVLTPDDITYDEARRVWNSMIDKRPALIVRASGTADVVPAVNFARKHDLFLAIKGGGHNVAGNAVCDDGLVIDLSLMKGIDVDPERRIVRVQPGATWGDLDHETQLHGLIVPGGVVSTTGIAGFTLAGGMSATRRKWGMTCDHLISAEVVTAAGEVLTVSDSAHADLFWALRGGGGNFGVVTSFEFRLRPLGPEITLAAPIYPLDQAHRIIPQWRDFMNQAPDEITSDIIFWSMPPLPGIDESIVGTPIFIVAGWYAGPASAGSQALQPFSQFGTPVADLSHTGRYVDIQSAFDPFFPDTQRYYWKSLFLDNLAENVIDALINTAASRPSPQSLMVLRALGGAIARTVDDGTAFSNRQAQYNISLDTTWIDATDDQQMVDWTRESWTYLQELTGGGIYLNFAGLGEDEPSLVQSAYGDNQTRLRQIKQRYDPNNLFRGNVNIASW